MLAIVAALTGVWFFASQTIILDLGFWLKIRLAVFSLVAGLLMAECFWMFTKLPFHVLNIDILLGVVYYTLWDIAQRYFSLRFTSRALMTDIAVCVVGIGAVLASAKWLP